MKKNSLLVVVLLGFLIFTTGLKAQKTGHLNRDAVLEKMPEVKKADEDIRAYAQTFEDEIKSKQDEYSKKVEDYKAKEQAMNDVIKQSKIEELNALGEGIKKFQVSAQEEVIKKRNELFKPIVDKFDNALKSVAKKNNYKYIIDTRNLLYFENTDDLTKLMEKELGIK